MHKQLRIDGGYDMIEKSESRIQQEIIFWFRNNYCTKLHEPQCAIFSVPNEGKNAKEQAAKIATGLMSGVSDLIVLLPGMRVLFIEVKDAKGTQKPKQKIFERIVTALGFPYYLVRSLEEFQKIIEKHLYIK
jgi:hypothetical protein